MLFVSYNLSHTDSSVKQTVIHVNELSNDGEQKAILFCGLMSLSTTFQYDDVNEPPHGKTNNVVSEQVRHKSTCTVTEKS